MFRTPLPVDPEGSWSPVLPVLSCRPEGPDALWTFDPCASAASSFERDSPPIPYHPTTQRGDRLLQLLGFVDTGGEEARDCSRALSGGRAGGPQQKRLLSRSLRRQAMSIAKVAYDEDWAEVARLTQTGPSLNPPWFWEAVIGALCRFLHNACHQENLALAKKEPGGLHASFAGKDINGLSTCGSSRLSFCGYTPDISRGFVKPST